MTRRLDDSNQPDYVAYLRGLSGVDLRFLLRRHCPGVEQPESVAAVVDLLTSKETAAVAVSSAEKDILSALMTLKALEGSAAIEDLVDISFFASDKETSTHDAESISADQRRQATEAEVRALYQRAERAGLVFQQPKGVFHIPPHISEFVPSDPTMATPVHFLVELDSHERVVARMANLGLLSEEELASDREEDGTALTNEFLEHRIREFLCSPRKVRALVDTAPAHIRKQIQYFAENAIFLYRKEWSPSRAQSIEWAEEHLLAVTFDQSVLPTQQSGLPSELDNASMCSAAALALKGPKWFIPRPHVQQTQPSALTPEEVADHGIAAVAFASAYMDAMGVASDEAGEAKGQATWPPFQPRSFEGHHAIEDFAATIGADIDAAPRIVELLICAGLVSEKTGHPTVKAITKWYHADASSRWAMLAAGFLQGRSPWSEPYPWHHSEETRWNTHAIVSSTVQEMAKEMVSMAGQLESNQMWWRCCVEEQLDWCFTSFMELNDCNRFELFEWLFNVAEDLGILVEGHSSWQAMCILYALHDIWLSGQSVGVDKMAELIAEFATGMVRTANQVHIAKAQAPRSASQRLVATLDGVPSNEVALALNFIGEREKCGDHSEWVVTENKLREAIISVDGDPDALFAQMGPLLNAPMKVVLYAELERAVKSENLRELLELESAVFEPDNAEAESFAHTADTIADADSGNPDDWEQLRLF